MQKIRNNVLSTPVLLLSVVGFVAAVQDYQALFPNGNNVVRNGQSWPGVGHNSAAGSGSTNRFGLDFASAGYSWTTALCNKDSDGDGYTNGAELGDPNCVWTRGGTPSRTTGISHPGFSDSFPPTTAAPVGPTTPTPPTTAAPPTTSAPPTTATPPTSAPSNSLSQTATFSNLFDISWQIYLNAIATDSDDVIDITMSANSDVWMGIGPSADVMDGTVVIGYVARTTDATTACLLRRTSGWDLSGVVRDASGAIIFASVVSSTLSSTGRSTITCRVPVAAFEVKKGSTQRFISAIGPMRGGVPQPHSIDTKQHGSVNFYAGTLSVGLVTTARVVTGALIHVVLIIWLIIGGILHVKKVLIRPAVNTAFAVLTQLLILCMLGTYFAVSYKDITDSWQSIPAARAFGHTASMSFMFIFYPVPKMFGFTTIMGSSYERVMGFHAFNALVVFLLVTCHFAAMSLTRLEKNADVVSANGGRYAQVPIAGFLSWLLMLVMIIASSFLKYIRYDTFRVVHMLFIPILILVIIHYPAVLITLAIPLLNYIADLVLRAVANHRIGAHVQSAVYHADAEVVEVQLQLKPEAPVPHPGCFGLFHLGQSTVPHPFSVAWYDAKTNIATLYIKRVGTFTSLVAAAAPAYKDMPTVVTGWHGSLMVPLDAPNADDVVLIAGGIGITAILSIAHAAVAQSHSKTRRVTLVWVIQKVSLVTVLSKHLAELLALAQGTLTIQIHVTQQDAAVGSPAIAPDTSPHHAGSALAGMSVIWKRRPNIGELLTRATPSLDTPLLVYTCGPATMMSDVADAVSKRGPATFLHTETFGL